VNAAEDRLAALEAEATLLRMRIRDAADTGDLDAVIALYRRIPELRLELAATRHTVARLVRQTTRQYGENTAINRAEHLLDVELATLGIEPERAMRNVFG
jgi:hypothetical protein